MAERLSPAATQLETVCFCSGVRVMADETEGSNLSKQNGLGNQGQARVCSRAAVLLENYFESCVLRKSTLPRVAESCSIMLSTALQAWMTVPWSRPPKASPISWSECLVRVRARYIAIWRGMAMLLGRRLLVMSLWRIW